MLQVARLAQRALGEAAGVISEFLLEQFNEDGGACDRDGKSDLYYTVFALDGLIALQREPPVERVAPYLASFGDGETLDLVHLCCLIRCHAAVGTRIDEPTRDSLARRLEEHRSADGGYAATERASSGTLYHAFLVAAAFQDLKLRPPDEDALVSFVRDRRLPDGSFTNDPATAAGNVPSTAAAVTLLRHYGEPPGAETSDYLLSCFRGGGFLATRGAPIPDLLSTATALHALSGLGAGLDAIREPCLDFVDTLWTGRAFCGNWSDGAADSEYTFYALLALGHLSV